MKVWTDCLGFSIEPADHAIVGSEWIGVLVQNGSVETVHAMCEAFDVAFFRLGI